MSVLNEHFAAATAALSAGRREAGVMAEGIPKHNRAAGVRSFATDGAQFRRVNDPAATGRQFYGLLATQTHAAEQHDDVGWTYLDFQSDCRRYRGCLLRDRAAGSGAVAL
jgi:hypothetical protein